MEFEEILAPRNARNWLMAQAGVRMTAPRSIIHHNELTSYIFHNEISGE